MENNTEQNEICHRCKWGAASGQLIRCNAPGLTFMERYTFVGFAVEKKVCHLFKPRQQPPRK